MKIEWMSRTETGQYEFQAEPGEYDGVPAVLRFTLDRSPLVVQHDVFALAGFLAFAAYCSGPVTLSRSVSPELARAMQSFLDPVWVNVSPIEFAARKAPEGAGFAFLSLETSVERQMPNVWGQPRNVTIRPLDSSVWSGYLVTSDQLLVGSNAAVVSALGPDSHKPLPYLAVALLFMESFRCSTLVVPDDLITDDGLWARLCTLVHACKYALLRESEARALIESRA